MSRRTIEELREYLGENHPMVIVLAYRRHIYETLCLIDRITDDVNKDCMDAKQATELLEEIFEGLDRACDQLSEYEDWQRRIFDVGVVRTPEACTKLAAEWERYKATSPYWNSRKDN